MVVVALANAPVGHRSVDVPQHPSAADARRERSSSGETDPAIPSVRIDAIVTDRNGKRILDLRPSDFEWIENGVVQKIGRVDLRTPVPTVSPELASIESAGDEERAARQQGTRVFAFFLDEFHVGAGPASAHVRHTLNRFIDEHLRPEDLAVVLKPYDTVSSIRFTRDRSVQKAAVDDFEGRKGDYAPRTTFESQYIGHAPAIVQAARVQIVTAALRVLAMRLGNLRADRAAIVLVSEGFPREAAGRQVRAPEVQGLVRAASRFHLAMYTVNPSAPDADASDTAERTRNTATLQWLASQTGGEAMLDGAAAPAGLRRMAEDLDSFYVLTYQPSQADGRFHAVEVRTTRREALVRARPGYWSPLGTEGRTLTTTPSAPRRSLRRSPIIDAWTGVTRGADGQTRLVVSWTPRGAAPRPAQTVVLTVKTGSGRALFDGRIGRVGAGGTLADRATFDAPAGRIELDMTVLAADGTTLDRDTRDVEVPDVRKPGRNPFLAPPAIIRTRTVREYRASSVDPNATPTPERTFGRSDRLLIRVTAWDAAGGSVPVTARILNQWGHQMRTIDQVASAPSDSASQFDLPLAWLAPGEYLIELAGTTDSHRAAERITIRVR